MSAPPEPGQPTTRKADLERAIRARPWFHTVDLGNGLVTNGDSPPSEIIAKAMPDVAGRSVLDIGAWDGKHSFEAERHGASRVVALDHYVWRLDPAARAAYYVKCEQDGVLPDPEMIDHGFLLEDQLPGKGGFDLLHEYLDSKVEAVVADFTTMDLETLGTFDVVFYFGVLYHMADPIGSLRRVRHVTEGVALIETAAIDVPAASDSGLVKFFAGQELHADYGNWFAPSASALVGMCRAAGFRKVDVAASTAPEPTPVAAEPAKRFRRRPSTPLPADVPVSNCRIVALAYP